MRKRKIAEPVVDTRLALPSTAVEKLSKKIVEPIYETTSRIDDMRRGLAVANARNKTLAKALKRQGEENNELLKEIASLSVALCTSDNLLKDNKQEVSRLADVVKQLTDERSGYRGQVMLLRDQVVDRENLLNENVLLHDEHVRLAGENEKLKLSLANLQESYRLDHDDLCYQRGRTDQVSMTIKKLCELMKAVAPVTLNQDDVDRFRNVTSGLKCVLDANARVEQVERSILKEKAINEEAKDLDEYQALVREFRGVGLNFSDDAQLTHEHEAD